MPSMGSMCLVRALYRRYPLSGPADGRNRPLEGSITP